ncbi:MAG: hypothetical protein ACI845_003517 [Gammaproteobacteria bacterium]
MSSNIKLFIPGLFSVPGYEIEQAESENELSALNHILRYGEKSSSSVSDFDDVISRMLDLPAKPAYVQAYRHQDGVSGNVQLARAVHLKADLRQIVVLPILDTSRNEADFVQLVTDLNQFFDDDFSLSDQGDLVRVMQLHRHDFVADMPHYLNVTGRNVNQFIEQSKQNIKWHQLINEVQMFLHQHSINEKRQFDGLLPINSIWCWGGGENSILNSPLKWLVDDSFVCQYLKAQGVFAELITDYQFEKKQPDTQILVLGLMKLLKFNTAKSLTSELHEINQSVISPAINLAHSQGAVVTLQSSEPFEMIYRRWHSLKRWRSRTNLNAFNTIHQAL